MSYDRILACARDLFAKQGYHGTSVRDITVAAKVNVGAITYHFGSKLELYHTVLRGFTTPLIARAGELSATPGAPLDRLEQRVRVFFANARNHPEMIPLMVREMASAGDLAEPIQEMIRGVIPHITGDIVAGQKDGTIRAGDPMMLTISTMAQPVYINLARKGLKLATGKDPLSAENHDRMVHHCIAMIRAMLEIGR